MLRCGFGSVTRIVAILGVCALAIPGSAQLTAIGPFTGTNSETWESFPNYADNPSTTLPSPSSIMGGAASISTTGLGSEGMYVYEPDVAGFGLGNSGPADVSDGKHGMGINSLTAVTTIVFANAATAFGAYWGAPTGVPFGDSTPISIDFFDASNTLIGHESFDYSHVATADGKLDWHGFSSTTAIKSLSYSGRLVVIDGLQANIEASAVPEPGTYALICGMLIPGAAFLRRRK